MTLVQPGAALDLGFQLSLAATAGLIAFGPWIRYALEAAAERARLRRFVPSLVIQVVALSVSATVATLPIVWVNFGRVSLIGPVANIAIEPLFVFAFWLSAIAAVAGAVSPTLGWFAGLGAYYPLALITWFARNAARLPFAAVDVPGANGTTALLPYFALAAAGLAAYRRLAPIVPESATRRMAPRRLLLAGAGATVAGIALVPVSLLPLLGADGRLSRTVLDAGDGDAILFTTPHGNRVLVNAGPSGVETARELGAVLPHWDRSIDVIIITQPQDEHAGGAAEVLRR
jgi:competence protein ComEC